ncbi:lycopene cyclase domain-containing protein [Micrococcales bacterium KH10]|nr:lycopene cyclase domain-containing protein [Micrococcales bacterium KH10]
MGWFYLGCLLAGIICMLLLDRRFRLFFFHDPAVALLIVTVGTGLLLLWDFAGIAAGVFFRGDATIASGIVLAPELPLEEPIFLIFLVLCTMNTFTGIHKVMTAHAERQRGRNIPSQSQGEEP